VSYEFCTLFDVNYLPRGLALHASLLAVEPRARLRVFCMDERTQGVLDELALPGLVVVGLGDLEGMDPELAAVKAGRNHVEYCWTATPSVLRYCLLAEPELEAITYLDADVYFFSNPAPLFDELGGDSVQIVPHRYAPQYAHQVATSGVYNVEWLTFRHDQRGLDVLQWWRERCLEWCYDRLEDGKFGDQMYLVDWPERFDGVGVLQHVGGGLAPWNVANYRLGADEGTVSVDGAPLVFYHFHALKLSNRFARRAAAGASLDGVAPLLWSSRYPRTALEERLIWRPYLEALRRSLELVRSVDPGFAEGFTSSRTLARQSMNRVMGRVYRTAVALPARVRRGPEEA
jgi:hypothetical protein